MTVDNPAAEPFDVGTEGAVRRPSTFGRVLRFILIRVLSMLLAVSLAILLTIFVANMGGYVDRIMSALIQEQVGFMARGGAFVGLTDEERQQVIADAVWQLEEAQGLHEPFLLRTLRWWRNGLTLDLGASRFWTGYMYGVESSAVRDIVLRGLPNTLLLMGTANLILFFGSLVAGLLVARKYRSLLDRVMVALSPLSSMPAWLYGFILIAVFAAGLHILPFGGFFDDTPPATKFGYVFVILRHMILPVSSVLLGTFFQSVYAWRTFFLIYASDDYVEMARARGLPAGMIERRYLARPALPQVLTSFALLILSIWSGSILLEMLFDWPGMGELFFKAVSAMDISVIIGFTIIYAYLLALTLILLEIAYVLFDPRVQVQSGNQNVHILKRRTGSLMGRAEKRQLHRLMRSGNRERRSGFIGGNTGSITQNRSRKISWFADTLRQVVRYPSAIAGSFIILVFFGIAIYAVIAIPYPQAVIRWRPSEALRTYAPRTAVPVWVNLFLFNDLPETIVQDSAAGDAIITDTVDENGYVVRQMDFHFEVEDTGGFAQDLAIFPTPDFTQIPPYLELSWIRPDGEVIQLDNMIADSSDQYWVYQDKVLQNRFNTAVLARPLLGDPASNYQTPLGGQYTLRVQAHIFEESSGVEVRAVLFGQVYGLAGTDNFRRDLTLPLLWGTPVALAFGLIAAVGATFSTMVLSAISIWFGGWVDTVIQRLTEINMVLPLLPVMFMVTTLYSHSIWLILAVTMLLSIFGSSIKNYRAIFMQFKEANYIEAARAYGASNFRIIVSYLLPRIVPVMIPQLVVLVPSYVFIEASLAMLGLSDPWLPTWGKVIAEAYAGKALMFGHYFWALEPVVLLMLISFAFAMLGIALDRVFNPRLRVE